ncbi:MAG: geranylgeranylglyceryl/heptaprenylglyceryl phosphate synthase [Ignavibacteriales bacterium]|nr:geranylgeranylglyceryl/heptaprenylglyceryl phosphate synthase [Ignavibacteriales bacterium]
MNIYQSLLATSKTKGAAYLVLVDPDKIALEKLPTFIQQATTAGADAFLVGGSLITDDSFERCVVSIKQSSNIPVVIFPGGVTQISAKADAILFLSLLSGRNPEHLIGDQVLAAPIVKKIGLEAISTAYMLVESGKTTSAEFMSNTRPLPRHKPDIALAHALAAEILGFKMIYLEAGSGADQSVPEEMIGGIAKYCTVPLIVGGGIKTPEEARKKVIAGASFIVTGTVFEKNGDAGLMKDFAAAIHTK